jgi:serine/threonine-protein kinase
MGKKRNYIGRYEILAELGRGSMGIVYKARDPQIDRLVAVKTISVLGENPEEDGDYLTRFLLEARAAGSLSHPGIVTIFDVGEGTQTRAPYIVMEFVAGQALSKLLAESENKLPIESALQLCQQLAEALDYAHTQGVVHRDMKPANVLVTDDGRAKIADFGIAKMNLALITLPGNVMGTPAFMSPEQLEGGVVDGRSDLFSLGVILYTMLTGHRPFQGNSAATVIYKVANREPLPATAFDSQFPPEIDYVLSKAMAKDPEARYQTGREMALDIKELLSGKMPRSKGDPHAQTATFPAAIANALRTFNHETTSRRITGVLGERHPIASRFSNRAYAYAAVGLVFLGLTLAVVVRRFQQEAAIPPAASPSQVVMPTPATEASLPPTPAAASPKAPTTKATLGVLIDHQFSAGSITFWVDNKFVHRQILHGEPKRRLVVFRGVHGADSSAMQVPAGHHEIRLRVTSTDGFDVTNSVVGDLPANKTALLLVRCDKNGKKVDLKLQ